MRITALRLVVAGAALFALGSCSDNSDEENGASSSGGVCTKWGATKTEVTNQMKNYEMKAMENGFICYEGKGDVQTISYQFQDGVLQAALLLIPKDETKQPELNGKYEYLGEKNGAEIYINETANTLATITEKTKGETTYYAVGYTALNDESSD